MQPRSSMLEWAAVAIGVVVLLGVLTYAGSLLRQRQPSPTPSPLNGQASPVTAEPSPVNRQTSPIAMEPSPLSSQVSPVTAEPSPLNGQASPAATGPSPDTGQSAPITPTPDPVAAATIQAALLTTNQIDTYVISFLVTTGSSQPDRTVLDFAGTFAGPDVAYTLARTDTPTASSTLPQQVITVNGITYAHGPLAEPEANQDAWYNLGSNPPPATAPPFNAQTILRLLLNPDVNLGEFTPTGTETRDDQPCLIFTGGRNPTLNALNQLGVSTTGVERPLEEQLADLQLEETSIEVSACADGYLRRVSATLHGYPLDTPNQPFATQVELVLSGIGVPQAITAPDEAIPLTP